MSAYPAWTIGCMSGTSADGVDAAAIRTDGVGLQEFGQTEFRPYAEDERGVIRAAFGDWAGTPAAQAADAVVTRAHLEVIQRFDFDAVIGFHGQTLAHDPGRGKTHQTGSAAGLAKKLGRTVVGDFRAADMKAGGEGAPLAPFYHFALARHLRMRKPALFLNLGGVANLSWVDPRIAVPESAEALIAFDTGPANGPIDDLVSERLGRTHDRNGELADKGNVCGKILERFLRDPYFDRAPPKSLDRDHFRTLVRQVRELDTADGAATLAACVAHSVAAGLRHLPETPPLAVVCGGGRKNPALMRMLKEILPAEVAGVDAFGINGDMLEAQAFGYLAVRALRNLPLSSPSTTGCRRPVSGGRIYR